MLKSKKLDEKLKARLKKKKEEPKSFILFILFLVLAERTWCFTFLSDCFRLKSSQSFSTQPYVWERRFSVSASSNSSHSDRVLKKRPSSVSSKASSSSGSGTKNTPLPKVTELQRNKFLEKENTVVPALQDKLVDRRPINPTLCHVAYFRRRLPDIAQEESKVLDQEQQLPPLHPSETDNYSKMVELFGSTTVGLQ